MLLPNGPSRKWSCVSLHAPVFKYLVDVVWWWETSTNGIEIGREAPLQRYGLIVLLRNSHGPTLY